ncbi:Acetoacetyl-CoA synthetase [Caenispirillum salinarum AK4]|uniref:Acetoacetyl-CoA synthetase n=1 Tax=Caenispirillum salinarum AK4 TaxID=1238182 RepID=K9HPB8_9PROT|nr:acetoacetate--CoA ligase [Caenispirillum salinarum]EKV30336.1 Acetoacetyl-CoA synthetase [Caenispirillum salinarum AK4]
MATKLWEPSAERIARANMTAFMRKAEPVAGRSFTDYESLRKWSVEEPEAFWRLAWDELGIIGEPGPVVVDDVHKLPGAKWFPEGHVNYAENLMRPRPEDEEVIVFRGEDKVKRRLTYGGLKAEVSRFQQALKDLGVGKGDRVAGYLPNMPETVIAMLATTGLGAIWSSASPDFGVQGVLDRFGQIEPKVLVACNGYFYNGKTHDSLEKLATIAERMPSLEKVVVVPYTTDTPDVSGVTGAVTWGDFCAGKMPAEVTFEPLPFDHPLFIMFSSGTTGAPKCIVHGHGGTLLQQVKEHVLHCDEKPGDRVFYFTTCGWMMWNWLVAALAAGSTLLLFDGSPFYPSGNVLFDYADEEKMTFFGTSAKWIDAVKKAGLVPKDSHDLSTVRVMASTGSPLAPESFDFVYEGIKDDIQLASISGGTDILSCFMLSNPIGPVYRGEIQCRGLAMDVHVFDDDGKPVVGQKGELVCTKAFPSVPVGFWNDPTGERFHNAYFDKYENTWTHGDWVELTATGGIIVYGRSDATLNPGGVRIGTAEIYRQVEKLEEVIEALVIGQDWDNDVRVVLFVRLREGVELTEDLIKRIKQTVKEGATPRHVPAKVVQVDDIPRTKSGKIVELAVRDVVHGRAVKNKEALANPEALELFGDIDALKS